MVCKLVSEYLFTVRSNFPFQYFRAAASSQHFQAVTTKMIKTEKPAR